MTLALKDLSLNTSALKFLKILLQGENTEVEVYHTIF